MKLLKRTLLVVSLFTMDCLRAELLVIKKTEQGFAPLDASDEKNEAQLVKLFLTYKWPQVIANTELTSQEMDELFTAGRPNAEEDFFRVKVKAIDPSYDVIFIPTSIYQLFVLENYFSSTKSFMEVLHKKGWQKGSLGVAIELAELLGTAGNLPQKDESVQETYKKVFEAFREYENVFYPAFFPYFNSSLARELFALKPDLTESKDAPTLSNEIEKAAGYIAASILNKPKMSPIFEELDPQNPSALNATGVLAKSIALEYQARATNKALLWRGNSAFKLPIGAESESLELLGSTSREGALQALAQRLVEPFSISFGNSPFAGLIYDAGPHAGACAYVYLVHNGGYALFVDKKYYIKNLYNGFHKSLDLFFIAPLSNLVSIFGRGEFFHSRVRAAVPPIDPKNPPTEPIAGLRGTRIVDPNGVLTTERDPLVHAEIFSKYLAKNMRVISKGDESNLTPEEKKAYEEKLKEAQLKAGQYYKAVRTLQPFAKTAAEKVRTKLAEKKLAEQAKEQE